MTSKRTRPAMSFVSCTTPSNQARHSTWMSWPTCRSRILSVSTRTATAQRICRRYTGKVPFFVRAAKYGNINQFNPNLHCFKTITKVIGTHVHWAPKGGGGCLFYKPEDLLIKNVCYIQIIIKNIENYIFLNLWKISLLRYFCEAFFIVLKLFCWRHPGLIFAENKIDLLVHKQFCLLS
jgi:hypothetical protein